MPEVQKARTAANKAKDDKAAVEKQLNEIKTIQDNAGVGEVTPELLAQAELLKVQATEVRTKEQSTKTSLESMKAELEIKTEALEKAEKDATAKTKIAEEQKAKLL